MGADDTTWAIQGETDGDVSWLADQLQASGLDNELDLDEAPWEDPSQNGVLGSLFEGALTAPLPPAPLLGC